MAYTLTAALYLGAANTGLTLTAELRNADGTSAVGLTTTNLAEVAAGSGSYTWTGTIPDSHRGYIRFLDGATFKTQVPIDPAEIERVDVKVSSRSSHTAADAAIAVWTAVSRTLTTSFTVDTAAIAAAVWAYVTRTLTLTAQEIIDLVSGSQITKHRGDTWTISLTGLGSVAARTALYFTIKLRREDEDEDALLQVSEAGGLLTLNGATYGTAAHATLVVDDANAGNITITVKQNASALIAAGSYDCDVEMVTATAVETMHDSPFTVNADVTRRIL